MHLLARRQHTKELLDRWRCRRLGIRPIPSGKLPCSSASENKRGMQASHVGCLKCATHIVTSDWAPVLAQAKLPLFA
eukprot:scaffold293616_cov14-Tisochrysis_lutea.AAC.1